MAVLTLEQLSLHIRVIQLSVGVTDFSLGNEQFKTFSEARRATMPLSKRAHQLRVVSDETRADEILFNVFTNQGIQKTGSGMRRVALYLVLLAEVNEESVSLRVGKVLWGVSY